MIVSDAGPIIIFARIGRLQILRQVTGSLTIPATVDAEIAAGGGGMPGAAEIAAADWIQRVELAEQSRFDALPRGLHQGERDAIALAKALSAQLLIDEIRGRRAADRLGVEVIGTLRILAEAKSLGVIQAVRPIIVAMQSSGYRFDSVLIRHFLDTMHEA